MGRDYRKLLIDETNRRNAESAKAYEGYDVSETDDIDELNAEVKSLTERIGKIDEKVLEADLNDQLGEMTRLKEEAEKLRFKRENTINKIKALKAEGARSASASGVSTEFQEKILNQEQQIASLKTQLAMVRSDVYEVKDMLYAIMDRIGVDRRDFQQDDD